MAFPKTEKAQQATIQRYKDAMRSEKRRIGFIDDGYGKRFIIFWLYLILNDLKGAKLYFKWYEKEFADCAGEPIQTLCWAILLHRMGNEPGARKKLAQVVLDHNVYMIAYVIGDAIDKQPVRDFVTRDHPDYLNEIPAELLNAITADDKQWLAETFNSESFTAARKSHAQLSKKLEAERIPEKRGRIREFMYSLADTV